jgi:hypothetical protein
MANETKNTEAFEAAVKDRMVKGGLSRENAEAVQREQDRRDAEAAGKTTTKKAPAPPESPKQ